MKRLCLPLALACTLSSHAQDPPSFIALPGTGTTGPRSIIGQPEGGFMIVAQPGTGGTAFIRTTATGVPIDAQGATEAFSRVVLCSDSGFLMMSTVFFQYTALVRTDRDLNVQWAKRLVAPVGYTPIDIAERDGRHYMVGTVQEAIIDPGLALYGTWCAVIHEFDDVGGLVDQCIVADTVVDPFRYGLLVPRLAPASDGSLYIVTSMLPQALAGTCNRQPTVVKLNEDLDLLWCKRYPITSYNEARSLAVLKNGDLAFTGHYTSNLSPCSNAKLFFARLDTSGAVLHARAYRHPFQSTTGFGAPLELPDSSLMFAHSHTDTAFGAAPFFDHIDTTGAVLGSVAFHHPGANTALRPALDGNGSLAACRLSTTDTLLFVPLTNAPGIYCHEAPHTTVDSVFTINVQPYSLSDHLSYPFAFTDTIIDPFEPIPVSAFPDCGLSTTVTQQQEADFTIFPNPSLGEVHISSAKPITELVVADALGRIVHRSMPQQRSVALEIPCAGIYVVRVGAAEGYSVERILIEGR